MTGALLGGRKHPVDCNHCAVVRRGTRPKVAASVRFAAKVERDPTTGCLLWMGARDSHGYGMFWTGERYVGAHRFALEQALGRPLMEGALHRCDTPPCVEPTHLFEGTAADNGADMAAKGRASRGIGRPRDAVGRWVVA